MLSLKNKKSKSAQDKTNMWNVHKKNIKNI